MKPRNKTRVKRGTSVLYNSFQHYGLNLGLFLLQKQRIFHPSFFPPSLPPFLFSLPPFLSSVLPSFLPSFLPSSLLPSIPIFRPSLFPSSLTSDILGIYICRFKLRFWTHRFCVQAFFPDWPFVCIDTLLLYCYIFFLFLYYNHFVFPVPRLPLASIMLPGLNGYWRCTEYRHEQPTVF